MKSLLRGLEERRKDEVIKSNLVQELKVTGRDLVNEHQEEGVLRSAEPINAFITALEATFIHGLKETILGKFASVMAGPDQNPEPEFWSLVLVFSHRDIISQIHKLTQITTDIGRCRAWIRLALNDSLLASYIESISVQNNALGPYYKKNAFLRDAKMLIDLKEVINSISNVVFEYPTNSCLLNYWAATPLLMAGLWTPPMKLTPSSDRADVASDIAAELPDETESNNASSFLTPMEEVIYDEDEALKIILGTPVEESLLKTMQENKDSVKTFDSSTQIESNDIICQEENIKDHLLDDKEENASAMQETDQNIVVSSLPVTNNENLPKLEQDVESKITISSKRKVSVKSEHFESFDTLLKNYNPEAFTSSPNEQSNLENVLQSYDMLTDAVRVPSRPVLSMSTSFIIEQELKSMVDHLGKFMSESGLISQNFLCKRCNKIISLSSAAAKVCGLTGHYYCPECYDEKEFVIPARIIHNWDFTKYSISGKAFAFLKDIEAHPLLNIRAINPRLYLIIPKMEELQKKRMKLNILRMFLMTCREPIMEALKKQLWPREYLYMHIHVYSVSDLLEIPSSVLSQTLEEAIKFCRFHVFNCLLCSQKGFICEVCNSKQIIYPFDLETTHRCPKCSLVVHAECYAQTVVCSKCLRREKRITEQLI